jgi:hypothetical protein
LIKRQVARKISLYSAELRSEHPFLLPQFQSANDRGGGWRGSFELSPYDIFGSLAAVPQQPGWALSTLYLGRINIPMKIFAWLNIRVLLQARLLFGNLPEHWCEHPRDVQLRTDNVVSFLRIAA